MKLFILLLISIITIYSVQAESPYPTLTSGDYALSQTIETVNKDTGKPEQLVIIETLKIETTLKKEIVITPMDADSRYFAKAKGFITENDRVQFGFTMVKKKRLFSVNYDGVLTDDGYIKGKVIAIYPGADSAVKGEWAMKLIAKPQKTISRRHR